MILDSPQSCHDSPTLPQYRPEEDESTFPMEAENVARDSHLSRSTCYSQSTEAEVYPMTGEERRLGLANSYLAQICLLWTKLKLNSTGKTVGLFYCTQEHNGEELSKKIKIKARTSHDQHKIVVRNDSS
ncbi:hypothetical protein Pst134EB_014098 [Puccinia striiformis f. sp. tritici]|nr:hypothetical protein Pst134EB_014098 [Puccinia striiformis f. sp. tritici]